MFPPNEYTTTKPVSHAHRRFPVIMPSDKARLVHHVVPPDVFAVHARTSLLPELASKLG